MTITLEVSPEMAARIQESADTMERARLALEEEFADEEEDEYDPPTEEQLAAIGRSLQDEREGRIVDGETVFARIRERFGWQEKSLVAVE